MASILTTASLTDPKPRLWTRDEFCRMAELGLFAGQRVDLIEGEIVQMTPQRNAHFVAIELVKQALEEAFGAGFWSRTQGPLRLTPTSEPEPDLAVVPGSPRDYTEHPSTALLVVEVSDTTLAYDRRQKAGLYARAGIEEYWIVNLVNRQVEVLRDPKPDPAHFLGFNYAAIRIDLEGDLIRPLAANQASIPVADLLP